MLLLNEVQPGKKIYDLCQKGDQLVNDMVNTHLSIADQASLDQETDLGALS